MPTLQLRRVPATIENILSKSLLCNNGGLPATTENMLFLNPFITSLLTVPRRLLVSQDHNEIYLIFAEYDEVYVQYVTDPNSPDPDILPRPKSKKPPGFLRMYEFGPFETVNKTDMQAFARIILAYALQQAR